MSVETPFLRLSTFISSNNVESALRAAAPQVSLACVLEGRNYAFSSDQQGAFSADTPLGVGCIARNLTSLLVANAVSEGLISYEDPVQSYCRPHGNIDSSLKIFHLLNNSHGLDGSSLKVLPYSRNGAINAKALWRVVSSEPAISPPGEHFYYFGLIGPWLVAAILEKIYGLCFSDLLKTRLLLHCCTMSRLASIGRICPAYGGFAMSASELLKVCSLHLQEHSDESLTAAIGLLRTHYYMQLPFGSALGESSGPGWYRFPVGTFGVFARAEKINSSMILLFPEHKSAAVFTGLGVRSVPRAQHAVIGRLFTRSDFLAPGFLTSDELQRLQVERIVGRYAKSSHVLDISCRSAGELEASVYRRNRNRIGRSPIFVTALIAKTEDTFLPANSEPQVLPFLKLGGETSDRRYNYAFTGRHTYRRIG